MKVSRFELIHQFIHFSNSDVQIKKGETGYDSLFKIRSLLINCQQSFKLSAMVEKDMSIDEMMCPSENNHSLKVYQPNKPIKRGYKIWAICGSKSGYVHRMNIFGDNFIGKSIVPKQIGKSGLVVLELAAELPAGTRLYFDNYFASPLLAVKLKDLGYESTMTLRGNRRANADKYMKTEKEMKKEGKGSIDFVQSNGVLVVQWYDSKLVTCASTMHSAYPTDIVSRFSVQGSSKTHVEVPRPYTIRKYNQMMGGVDLADQYMAHYRVKMKTNK